MNSQFENKSSLLTKVAAMTEAVLGSDNRRPIKYLRRWAFPNGLEVNLEHRGQQVVNIFVRPIANVPVPAFAELRQAGIGRISSLTPNCQAKWPVVKLPIRNDEQVAQAAVFLSALHYQKGAFRE